MTALPLPSIRKIRTPGLVVLWALMALAMRDLAPWAFWASMILLPCFALFREDKAFFRSPTAKRIYLLCGAVLLAHFGWDLWRLRSYNPAADTFWHDDHDYFRQAGEIAEAWKAGFYPDLTLKGSPPYLGTLHVGYHRALAAMFMLLGRSTLAGLLLNALCAAAIPLLMGLCARYLWPIADKKKWNWKDPAFAAAAAAALHPNQFYWGGFLLKDVFTAFTVLATLATVLGACQKRKVTLAVASLMLLPFLFSVRAYAALSIVAGVGMLPLLRLTRRQAAWCAGGGLVLLIMLCEYTLSGSALFNQLLASLVALASAKSMSAMQLILQTLASVPRLFLSPYAWLIYPDLRSLTQLYPGMWYMYVLIWPLVFSGLASALWQNRSIAVIPLAVFGLAALIFLSSAYAGNATRQRYYLEYIAILFAVFGLQKPNWWWIAGIWIAELAFGVGQVIALMR